MIAILVLLGGIGFLVAGVFVLTLATSARQADEHHAEMIREYEQRQKKIAGF